MGAYSNLNSSGYCLVLSRRSVSPNDHNNFDVQPPCLWHAHLSSNSYDALEANEKPAFYSPTHERHLNGTQSVQ